MAEVVVDGRSVLASPGSRVLWMAETGLLAGGERRWASTRAEVSALVADEGWQYLATATDGARLVWRPVPAVPAVPVVAAPDAPRLVCRRCGAVLPDYLAFGVGHPTRAVYCLHHVPRWVRLRMWLRGLVRRG